MVVNRVALFFLFSSILTCAVAQRSEPLQQGPFNIGFKVVAIPYFNSDHSSDTIQIILNLWYPIEEKSGARMRLLDYLHIHKKFLPAEQYNAFAESANTQFKKFIDSNFGRPDSLQWQDLTRKSTPAFYNAPYSKAFPLIVGRLRAFSTTYTNEFLASHGYVICMINGVEDFPPDNRPMYHRQISREIEYYDVVRKYLSSIKIVTDKAGLMGFSGGGFSQFFIPMHQGNYDAVALLESGIFLDGDLFDIVSAHPYFNPQKFNTPLLFFYNKQRFEANKASMNFHRLNTNEKYLVLFDDREQHHWDFATEGIASALFLQNRPEATAANQAKNFMVMNNLLLQFFDRYLKGNDNFKLSNGATTIIDPKGW